MNNQAIIDQATAELRSQSGHHFLPAAIAEAVEAGLQDGDKIDVGGFSFVAIDGDTAIFLRRENAPQAKEVEVNRLPLASLNDAQVSALLKCKAKSAAVAAVRK